MIVLLVAKVFRSTWRIPHRASCGVFDLIQEPNKLEGLADLTVGHVLRCDAEKLSQLLLKSVDFSLNSFDPFSLLSRKKVHFEQRVEGILM
jgi:hypothetical protein